MPNGGFVSSETTHLQGIHAASNVSAREVHEEREYALVSLQPLAATNVSQAVDEGEVGRLSEAHDAGERSERSERCGVEVVADTDDRASQWLGRCIA